MDREAKTCVLLSKYLSPIHFKVVTATYTDLNTAFFCGRGYCLTLAQLNGTCPPTSYVHHNSKRMLEFTANILNVNTGGLMDAYGICCAFNIPIYHVLQFVPDHNIRFKLLHKANERTYLTSKHIKSKMYEYKQFALLKKSRERNEWWRHTYEMYCLCRYLTEDFTKKVVRRGGDGDFTPSDPKLFRRIYRLIKEGFGGSKKYVSLLGEAVVEAAYLAYSLLTGREVTEEVQFVRLCMREKLSSIDRRERSKKLYPVDNLTWFLAGKYEPSDAVFEGSLVSREPLLDSRCKTLTFPALEANMHINIQVAHVKVLSKERMLYGVLGKSLVFTVIKKKTVACSSYKVVEADWCVPTENSLNFNIQGYDLSVMCALVTLHKLKRFCSIDDMVPLAISHTRYSTHSFQNGVQNINSYRHKVVRDNKATCSKVPHFPVVKMVNTGLLHRETVLINVKPNIEKVADTIYVAIRNAAENDDRLSAMTYELETKINELVDNQILGIFKTAYLFGMEDVARCIPDTLLCDRLLVSLNPKNTKSEFADKSKFDSESKGKASKKIKVVDKTKDRKGFLSKLDEVFPDVFIDPNNSNSRGKWSFTDRINHSPDWIFYSPFTLALLTKLREMYPKDKFPSFNDMVDMMIKECANGIIIEK